MRARRRGTPRRGPARSWSRPAPGSRSRRRRRRCAARSCGSARPPGSARAAVRPNPAAAGFSAAACARPPGAHQHVIDRQFARPTSASARSRPTAGPSHRVDLLLPAEHDALPLHRRLRAPGQVRVEERQQRVAAVDRGGRGRPARRTCTRTRCRSRPAPITASDRGMRRDVEQLVGVVDAGVLEREHRRAASATSRWR